MLSEKQKFAQRLNEALDELDLPEKGHGRQAALAKTLGVEPKLAGQWLRGEDFPKTSKLVKLAQYLGIRSNWLLLGTGDKYPSEEEALEGGGAVAEPSSQEEQVNRQAILSNEAFELAIDWMKLPERVRVSIKNLVAELAPH